MSTWLSFSLPVREQLDVEPHAVAIGFDRNPLVGAVNAAGVVGTDHIGKESIDVVGDLLVLPRVGPGENERRGDQSSREDLPNCARSCESPRKLCSRPSKDRGHRWG